MLKPLGISEERKAPRWGTQAEGTNLMPGLKMKNAHPHPSPLPFRVFLCMKLWA